MATTTITTMKMALSLASYLLLFTSSFGTFGKFGTVFANDTASSNGPLDVLDPDLLIDRCSRGNVTFVEEAARKFGPRKVVQARSVASASCFVEAAQGGHWPLVELLLSKEYGDDIDQVFTKDGRFENETLLHIAALMDDFRLAKGLLDRGANVDAATVSSDTPLHYAALGGPKVVELLLKYGANVDAANNLSETPLHYAAAGSPKVVELLLKYGADIEARDEEEWTPLRKAIIYRVSASIKMLTKMGASLANAKNSTFLSDDFKMIITDEKVRLAIKEGLEALCHNGGCHPNATCTVNENVLEIVCSCNPGFLGDGDGLNGCKEPCLYKNGGCNYNASCALKGMDITCSCKPGFTGTGKGLYGCEKIMKPMIASTADTVKDFSTTSFIHSSTVTQQTVPMPISSSSLTLSTKTTTTDRTIANPLTSPVPNPDQVDACARKSPCVNGGTCFLMTCREEKNCEKKEEAQCKCPVAYKGDFCQIPTQLHMEIVDSLKGLDIEVGAVRLEVFAMIIIIALAFIIIIIIFIIFRKKPAAKYSPIAY